MTEGRAVKKLSRDERWEIEHKRVHDLEDELARLRKAERVSFSNAKRLAHENARLREGLERLRQQSENKSEATVTLLAALREADRVLALAQEELKDPAWDLHTMTFIAAMMKKARAAIREVEGEIPRGNLTEGGKGFTKRWRHAKEPEPGDE